MLGVARCAMGVGVEVRPVQPGTRHGFAAADLEGAQQAAGAAFDPGMGAAHCLPPVGRVARGLALALRASMALSPSMAF